MVYAANGATVVDGLVYSAKFRHRERQPEGPAYQKWFADAGFVTHTAAEVNEGEGDLLVVGDVVLAGTGFRTEPAAHRELATLTGREVVTLELVNPHFYHLDTALTVLDPDPAHPLIAYHPQAFSPASQAELAGRYPDAILVAAADAAHLGLNAVSDGLHVVVAPRALGFADAAARRGLRAAPGGHQRAAQGRRRREVLHAGDPARDGRRRPRAGRRTPRHRVAPAPTPPTWRTTTTRCRSGWCPARAPGCATRPARPTSTCWPGTRR